MSVRSQCRERSKKSKHDFLMIFNSYEIIQHASFFTQTRHFIIFVDVVRLSQGPAVGKFADTMPTWWFCITINVQLAPNTAVTQCAAQPLILSGQLWLFTCRMRRGVSTSFPKVMGAQHFRKPACTIASPPTLFPLVYNPIFPVHSCPRRNSMGTTAGVSISSYTTHLGEF